MSTLTVTAKGQVTLKKEILKHLGVEPGTQVEVDLLPNGRVEVKAATRRDGIEGFIGVLAGKTRKVASIDEMREAGAQGWSGKAR